MANAALVEEAKKERGVQATFVKTISGSSRVSNGKLVLVCSPSGSLSTMIGSGTLSWRKRRRVVEGGGDGDVVGSHGQHVGEGDS